MPDVDVEVWYASLDAAHDAALLTFLSADERTRAARFALERHRRRWATSRALLRWLLSRELDVAPARLRFDRSDAGKPRLAGTGYHVPRFSVAHSGSVALYALCREREVGVDVEHERQDIADGELTRVARRVFSPAELAALEPLSAPQRRREFHRLWVRKEAYLKATGEGLLLEPGLVTVLGPRTGPTVLRPAAGVGAARPWTIVDLPAAGGCPAAVAVEGEGATVHCRALTGARTDSPVGLEPNEAVSSPLPASR